MEKAFQVNPIQLKKARLARGYTMSDLAKEIGVTRQAISQYEMGEVSPKGENLVAIIHALDFPRSYFQATPVEMPKGAAFFRSRAISTKKSRIMQEMRIEYVYSCYEYLSSFITLPSVNLPKLTEKEFTDLTNEDIKQISTDLREHWGLGTGPINNLVNILEVNGIIISESNFENTTLDAVSQWIGTTPIIVLANNNESAVRRRFSIAHELGHILLHGSVEDVEILDNKEFKNIIERQADYFASTFLMPDDAFLDSVLSISLDYFIDLKKFWLVSIQSMVYKCWSLKIINDDQNVYLNKKISKNRWRKSEPLDTVIEVEKPEIFSQAATMLLDNNLKTKSQLADDIKLPRDEISKILRVSMITESQKETPKLRLIQ